MKQSKMATLVLIIFMVFGWLTALLSLLGVDDTLYTQHLTTAEDYVGRGLYQKAITEYEAALAIQTTQEVWNETLNTYARRYAEDGDIYDAYVTAANTAVATFSADPAYLKMLTELYMSREHYAEAYKVLQRAIDNGMENEEIDALQLRVKYAFELDWKGYETIKPCVNGFYPVSETGLWKYIDEEGMDTDFTRLLFAGAVGQDGVRVMQDGETQKVELIDEAEVLQGFLSFTPVDTGVFAEGLIAISDGSSYAYYNSLGDKQFGDYTSAGAFVNGEAAVEQDGKWFLIDTQGNKVGETVYEDIVLGANGTHRTNGVMLAKARDCYEFYHEEEIFGSYEQVDVLTDAGIVAVCNGTQWSFVDTEGNPCLDATFAQAKSFSNGLAAVSNGDRWGFINTDGVLVIDYAFYDADYFNTKQCCFVGTGDGTMWQLISLYVKES